MPKIEDPVLREQINKYQREYRRIRRRTDPEFAKAERMSCNRWRKKNREKYNSYMRNYMKKWRKKNA